MSWMQLLVMAQENAINWSAIDKMRPYLCPLCAYPLQSNPRNQTLDCPMGHYTWPTGMDYTWKDGI